MSPHSVTLSRFRANHSLIFLLNAARSDKQIPILQSLVWPDRSSIPRSTVPEASTLTIAVWIVYMLTSSKLLMHNNCWFDCHTKLCIVDDGLIRNGMLCNDQHVSHWFASSEECGILHTRGTPSLPVLRAVDFNEHTPPPPRPPPPPPLEGCTPRLDYRVIFLFSGVFH